MPFPLLALALPFIAKAAAPFVLPLVNKAVRAVSNFVAPPPPAPTPPIEQVRVNPQAGNGRITAAFEVARRFAPAALIAGAGAAAAVGAVVVRRRARRRAPARPARRSRRRR